MSFRRRGAHLPLLLALMAIGLAGGCGQGGDSTVAGGSARTVPPGGSLAAGFSAFGGFHSAEDTIPPTLLPRRITKRLKFDRDDSRRARLYRGQPVFVLSSDRLTCTFSHRNEVSNCWPTETVRRGLATGASICGLGGDAGRTVVYGLLPDGVKKVTVPGSGESTQRVPVVGNVYIAAVSSTPPLPQRVHFTYDGTPVEIPTGIPPEVARNGCGNGMAPPRRPRTAGPGREHEQPAP